MPAKSSQQHFRYESRDSSELMDDDKRVENHGKSAPVLVDVQGLGVTSRSTTILKDVDLAIRSGEIFALMGPDGSGKSTLVRAISGDERWRKGLTVSGEIKVNGESLDHSNAPLVVRQQLDWMGKSVYNYLASGFRERERMTRKEGERLAIEHCRKLGADWVEERLSDDFIDLSRPERMCVALLTAAFSRSALLCIHEPTSEMDDEQAELVLDLMKALAGERSVLWVSHDQSRVRAIADRVGLMFEGQLHAVQRSQDFFDEHNENPMVRAFVATGECSTGVQVDSQDSAAAAGRSEAKGAPDSAESEDQAHDAKKDVASQAEDEEGQSSSSEPRQPEASPKDEAVEVPEGLHAIRHQSAGGRPAFAGRRSLSGGPAEEVMRFPGQPLTATGPWARVDDQADDSQPSSISSEQARAVDPVLGALRRMDLAGFPRPASYASDSLGPNGFRWILPGLFGGTPRPGIFERLSDDLAALKGLGVEHVINLCDEPGVPEAAEEAGLVWHHFPVAEINPPSIQDAVNLCTLIDHWMERKEPVVAHCRACVGRTGTLAVAYLVFRGVDVATALREVRGVDEQYVQSGEQEEFFHEFEQALM
jgi:ABC-type multidrug transport system ATPase subunit/protein tyrosine phosphatase (PTP) superfamily phosphohydrolase (DUF442 family)